MTKLSGLPTETSFSLSDLILKVKAGAAGDVLVTLQNLVTFLGSNRYVPYKFSAHQVGAQTPAASTWSLVNLDTKDFDTSSNFNTTTHLFTAPAAGFYQFNAGVAFGTTADTAVVGIGLYKNITSGTPTYQGNTMGNGGASVVAL